MSLFQVTKKQVIENYELKTITGDIVSFTPSYSQLLPDPFSDLNVTVNVEATGGNGTPDSPIPINGYTEANITRCGVNLWDEEWELGAIQSTTGQNYNSTNAIRSKNYIPAVASVQYYFKNGSTSTAFTFCYDANKNYLGFAKRVDNDATNVSNRVFYLLQDTAYIRFYVSDISTYNNDICINYPSSDMSYHAYNGTTVTIAFGQTVYGGTLDVTRGKLSVTHEKYTITGSETFSTTGTGQHILATSIPLYSTMKLETDNNNVADMLCTIAEAKSYNALNVSGTTDGIGIGERFLIIGSKQYDDWANCAGEEICYPLSTPIEIDLTPVQIRALVGENNVYADCGETTVTCLI